MTTTTTNQTKTISTYLGQKVKKQETLTLDGTFESLYAAKKWALDNGYVYGSLCRNAPVALKKGTNYTDYDLPQKWRNMSNEDIKSIDGVIISDNFRNGSVTVILF